LTLIYSWGGKPFSREGDLLYRRDGRNVGRLEGNNVWAPDGRYLGEIMSGMLIRKRGRASYRSSAFAPAAPGPRLAAARRAATVMYAGCEDFPDD
jgi:hypothetical protein